MMNKVIIGVDISKGKLDFFCLQTKEHFTLLNSDIGLSRLNLWIEQYSFKYNEISIVFENTGSYGKKLCQYCNNNSITYYQINALEIKLSQGISRGKNDKIDAKRIATYFYEKQYKLKPSEPDSKEIERLKQLRASRDLLVKQLASIKTSLRNDSEVLELSSNDLIVEIKTETIQYMESKIKKINTEIDRIISTNRSLKINLELLCTIVGIGKVIALDTIMATDNFKKFQTWRQYASYSGSAPFENESGKSIKPSRISSLSRKDLKANLTSGARSAVQYDQELKQYYTRKLEEGKRSKCVINNVRAKLIARMFAVIKNQTAFKKNYSHYLEIQTS